MPQPRNNTVDPLLFASQIEIIEGFAHKEIGPGYNDIRQQGFHDPLARRNRLGHETGHGEMGHENGPIDNHETIEQIPVQGRFSGQKENRYQNHIDEREQVGQKKVPLEVKGTGVQFIGHPKRVDPVVKQQSSQGQQEKGKKQRSSGHISLPLKKFDHMSEIERKTNSH